MNKVLGIDISDISTSLIFYPSDEAITFPTMICKDKENDEWLVGERGLARALAGKGVITDKLLTLTKKHGMATLNGIKYEGRDILKSFFKVLIDIAMKENEEIFPDEIVVSMPKIESDIVGQIKYCFTELGYEPSKVIVISRQESFVYYVMSLSKDVWNNQVGLFDLSDISLTYYEMKIVRNPKHFVVYAESRDMDEAFNIDILKTEAGSKLADKILTSVASKVLQKKLFSSIILTGKAFDSTDWAVNFLHTICMRRKVFVDGALFAKGASYRGADLVANKPLYNMICICDGRLDVGVAINIIKDGNSIEFPLANIGDPWYQARSDLRLIPENVGEIEFILKPIDAKKKKKVVVPLDFLPNRNPKTIRIDIKTEFSDEKTLQVDMVDTGFGDLYPASGRKRHIEVELWD